MHKMNRSDSELRELINYIGQSHEDCLEMAFLLSSTARPNNPDADHWRHLLPVLLDGLRQFRSHLRADLDNLASHPLDDFQSDEAMKKLEAETHVLCQWLDRTTSPPSPDNHALN